MEPQKSNINGTNRKKKNPVKEIREGQLRECGSTQVHGRKF